MGHCVTGIIAKPEVLDAFSVKFSLHKPLALSQGLSLLPLRDDDIDSFLPPPHTDYPDGFTYLSAQLSEFLAEASRAGPILYFETEYFGGAGAQAASVYSHGTFLMQPVSAEFGPINSGLAMLGVTVTPGTHDEFESIGLNRHRYTEDWLE